MKKGVITQILDYYFTPEHSWMFGSEIERAVQDFFDGEPTKFNEDTMGHFSEWFLYDFKLSAGETPLEYFYNKNPLRLSEEDLVVYKDIQENIYDVFEVKDVRPEKGLSLDGVCSDKKYEIQEKVATRDLRCGDFFACRIMKVGDHYELTGGSAFILPQMLKGVRGLLKDMKGEFNPRIMFRTFILKQQDSNYKEDKIAGSDDTILVSGSLDGSSMREDDNCAVCRLMRKTRTEGRQPSKKELEHAMKEAEDEKRASR